MITTFKANYYDGRSSAQIPVSVSIDSSGHVTIEGETLALETTMEQLTIANRLGNTRRSLFLADGSKLETEDNDTVDRICRQFAENPWPRILHQLEQGWSYVLPIILISVVFIWGFIEFGVPIAAQWTAKRIPLSIEQKLGEQSLATLEDSLFSDSTLAPDRQQQLQHRFQQFTSQTGASYHYRLLLRHSKRLGANALALPGGIIIATDALVELAENDTQLLAVLAHEMGHVEHRHNLRSMLQNSLTALLMIALLGDASSVSSLSATLPTLLVQTRYSRQFEQQADLFALDTLQKQQIEPEHLIRILSLLEQTHHGDNEFDYLSSHPAMSKRITLIESKQSQ